MIIIIIPIVITIGAIAIAYLKTSNRIRAYSDADTTMMIDTVRVNGQRQNNVVSTNEIFQQDDLDLYLGSDEKDEVGMRIKTLLDFHNNDFEVVRENITISEEMETISEMDHVSKIKITSEKRLMLTLNEIITIMQPIVTALGVPSLIGVLAAIKGNIRLTVYKTMQSSEEEHTKKFTITVSSKGVVNVIIFRVFIQKVKIEGVWGSLGFGQQENCTIAALVSQMRVNMKYWVEKNYEQTAESFILYKEERLKLQQIITDVNKQIMNLYGSSSKNIADAMSELQSKLLIAKTNLTKFKLLKPQEIRRRIIGDESLVMRSAP
jgi:hypothetical protein